MHFKHYKEFQKNLKTDLLISKFCPYSRSEILLAVELINNQNKTVDWLFEVLNNNKKGNIIEIVNKALKEAN